MYHLLASRATKSTNKDSLRLMDGGHKVRIYKTKITCWMTDGSWDRNIDSVVLPDTITELASGAFADCGKLTKIRIPKAISKIKYNTFSNCSALISIMLPDHVNRIDEYAFSGCVSLKSISIPNTFISIEDFSCFYHDSRLQQIDVRLGESDDWFGTAIKIFYSILFKYK